MKILLTAIILTLPALGVTVTSTACCTTAQSVTSTITFDGVAPNTNDAAGYATYSGTWTFNGASNPGGGGNWITQSGGQLTVITFSQPIEYFGLLWGTSDGGNTVRMYNGATQVGPTINGNGSITTSYINIFAGAGEQFTRVELSDGGCCFENDNHSYRLLAENAVPEPGSLLLAAAGLAFVTLARRRR